MTTETNATVTNAEKAQEIINGTTAYAVQEIKLLLDEVDYRKREAALSKERATQSTSRYLNLFNTLEEFIKEHVKDEQISIDDLKELAEEVNIELTKSVRVTFNVKCEYEFTVPLDFEDDDITDGDFTVRISSNVSDEDVEETSESYEIEDFEVEDND